MTNAPGAQPYLLTVGDIGVTDAWVVTPNGHAPLHGSQWIVVDRTVVGTRLPPYAIVLAVVFAVFCLLGLLFLLIKEQYIEGYVEVQVRSGTLYHVAQLPISQPLQVQQIRALVAQAQSLAAAAPPV